MFLCDLGLSADSPHQVAVTKAKTRTSVRPDCHKACNFQGPSRCRRAQRRAPGALGSGHRAPGHSHSASYLVPRRCCLIVVLSPVLVVGSSGLLLFLSRSGEELPRKDTLT